MTVSLINLLLLLGSTTGTEVPLTSASSSTLIPSSISSTNGGMSAVKKGCKEPPQNTVTNIQSPCPSSQMETHQADKHIRGSVSTSSINNNHRQGCI